MSGGHRAESFHSGVLKKKGTYWKGIVLNCWLFRYLSNSEFKITSRQVFFKMEYLLIVSPSYVLVG